MAASISSGVGEAADNLPADVAVVQDLLNRVRGDQPALTVDGLSSALVEMRIARFQTDVMGMRQADRRVMPGGTTWRRLLDEADQRRSRSMLGNAGRGAGAIGKLDVPHFVKLYVAQYNHTPSGIGTLVNALRADPAITDMRWAAYMMATIKWETAGTFQPIEEYGKGVGHSYGEPAPFTDFAGNTHNNIYYGRGYVQLTWLRNYRQMGQALGLGDRLAADPAQAMDPVIAYRILSVGMREGLFTGHKLGEFIKGADCDYVNARKIINGLDQAEKIAQLASDIEKMLPIAMADAA